MSFTFIPLPHTHLYNPRNSITLIWLLSKSRYQNRLMLCLWFQNNSVKLESTAFLEYKACLTSNCFYYNFKLVVKNFVAFAMAAWDGRWTKGRICFLFHFHWTEEIFSSVEGPCGIFYEYEWGRSLTVRPLPTTSKKKVTPLVHFSLEQVSSRYCSGGRILKLTKCTLLLYSTKKQPHSASTVLGACDGMAMKCVRHRKQTVLM